jgi:hypothetical protein
VYITNICWLTVFTEIIAVCSQNHTKPINESTLCGQNSELLIVNTGGTYSYHWGLKCSESTDFMSVNTV